MKFKNSFLIIFIVFLVIICHSKDKAEIKSSNQTKSYYTQTSYSAIPWSVRMVESEIKRRPNHYSNGWGYVDGTF